MAIFKVSYVVTGKDHPGTIVNLDHRPRVGERVLLGDEPFVIVEVIDLLPPRGEFHYLHATCEPVEE